MHSLVKVELGARSYEIRVGPGLLNDLGPACAALGLAPECLVVSDGNVDGLYGPRAEESLKAAGFRVRRAAVPAGETSKSKDVLFSLYDRAIDAGLGRKGFVVALGGGVVGDLGGYLAASYLRGIRYVQVPTSLLAMVDSSVGGKTGINLPQGKNLVGSFHQPVLVLADMDTLKTLPEREYLSGLAEVVKYGAIRDGAFFHALEKLGDKLRNPDSAELGRVIARCCELKAEVVGLDERESGLRAILNFGHTLGHAIEQVTGYGTHLHGEAISIGMVFAAQLSHALKGLPAGEVDRLRALLERVKLPVRMPECPWADIRHAMSVDKKGSGKTPKFVLLERIGHAAFGCEVPENVLETTWSRRA